MNLFPGPEELAQSRQLVLGLSLHVAPTFSPSRTGLHQGRDLGRGLEFEELRSYIPGDDIRSIDWRVTARRGRVHTRLYREEKERPVWIVPSFAANLFFGSRRQLKSALALRLTALLGWIGLGEGDRVGLLVDAPHLKEPLFSPAQSRTEHWLTTLQQLSDLQPRTLPPETAPTLAQSLLRLQPHIQSGSLVIVIGDHASFRDDCLSSLVSLRRRSTVILCNLYDPLERSGLPDGWFRIGRPGQSQRVYGASSRTSWSSAWQEQNQLLQSFCSAHQIRLLDFVTAEDPAFSLASHLGHRPMRRSYS